MQYPAKPCHTMQYLAILCNTMQCHTIQCNSMQYHALPCIINKCWRSVPLPCGQYNGHFLHSKSTKRIPCCSNTWHSRWQAKWRQERRVWVGRRLPRSLSHLNKNKKLQLLMEKVTSHVQQKTDTTSFWVCRKRPPVEVDCWSLTLFAVPRIAGYPLQHHDMCKE